MTKREYLLWLQAKRNQHPGITMQPSRPGPYGEPQWASFGGRPAWMDQQQVPAKDITTVIKEYEDDTPNTKTTTIKGGLLGDPAQDWAGKGAERDEAGMQMWYDDMAQQQARVDQGTAAPSQAEIEASLRRYGDVRRSQFTPPPPQAPPPPVDPRFQRMMPGQDRGMVDPSWSAAVPGSNVPPRVPRAMTGYPRHVSGAVPPQPARLPLAHGQDDPQDQRGMKGRPWVLPQDARAELERKRREADQRQRYAQQELGRMTPPPESRPVDTGSSIADARMAAIAEANRLEADEEAKRVAADERAKKSRLAQAEIPTDYGQDDPAGYEGWSPGELDQYMEVQKQRRLGLEAPYPSMAIDPKDMAGYHGERPGTPGWAKGLADVLGIALPVDLVAGGLNKLLGMLGAPQEALEDPVLGRQWIMRNAEKVATLVNKGKDAVVSAATDQPPIRDAWLDKVDEWRERVANRKAINEDIMDAEEMARAGMPDPLPPKMSLYPRQQGVPVTGPPPPSVSDKKVDVPGTGATAQTGKEAGASAGAVTSDKPTSKSSNDSELRNNPQLAAMWGKYAYDPAARKKVYLDNLKQVYKKALMLDIIAQLTGGKSRSKEYLKMATTKLDAVDQFDQEQRVSNIWRQVFTGTDGEFYMPKTKREASERAHFFGGDPKTVASIFGSVPEERKVQYYREDPSNPKKWEVTRSDVDPGPTWIAGQPRSKTPAGDELLADRKMDRYNQLLSTYESATGEDKVSALRNLENWASFAKLKTGGITEQQNRAFSKDLWKLYFTEDEAMLPGAPTWEEYYYGTGEFVLPKSVGEKRTVRGYGAGGGGETLSGSERSYASEADFTARAELEGVKSGDWVIVAGNRRKVK